MILRPAGSSPAFNPPASRHRSKLSPEAMAAIVMSLVFHACVGAYLYAHHFNLMNLPTPRRDEPLTITTVTFPPPPPPPPSTHEKRQPPRREAQEPVHVHEAPIILGLNPGPPIEVPSAPPGGSGGAGGGGQGLAQSVTPPPPAPPKPKVILNPDWIRKPSGAQLADAYPGRALDLGIAGSVTLLCAVEVNGQVRDCKVAEETPGNYGFGAAALKLSRWFRIRPETEDGHAVDGAQVRVPLKFGVG